VTGKRWRLALALGAAALIALPSLALAHVERRHSGRRREVFVPGPRALAAEDLDLEPGTVCVGDGAVRYRAQLEAVGADVPPDDDERHVPRARFHAALARDFGSAEAIEPIYVRVPDAERSLAG